jgi:hypothetical protein
MIIWGLIILLAVGLFALYKVRVIRELDHPLFLITLPILICLLFLTVIEELGIATPSIHLGMGAFLFLLVSFFALLFHLCRGESPASFILATNFR